MPLRRLRIVRDQLDDACELVNLKQCMPHAELGKRASSRIDQLPTCGGAAAKRVEHALAPRRGCLHDRRSRRDAKQPHDIEAPPARARNRVGAPQRREWRVRQHTVDSAVFTRPSSRSKSLIQGGFTVADSSEAPQARGADGVGLGLPRRVVQSGQLFGGQAHCDFDFVQALGMGEH